MRGGDGRLLLFAAAGDRGPRVLERCRGIAHAGIDWERLLARASGAGEAGNLADLLTRAGIVAPCAEALRAAAERELHRTLVMRRSARDIARMLSAEGIEFIPLKGADPRIDSLRGIYNPMTDIDILVPEDACERAAEILLEHGWRFLGKTSGSHLTFYRPAPECLLELHWDVVNRGNPLHAALFSPSLERVWARSIPAGGMRLLAPADNLAYLTAHAVKEYFHKPKWLADIQHFSYGIAFDEHTRMVLDEWGARTAYGIVVAAVDLLHGEEREHIAIMNLCAVPGFSGRLAARGIASGKPLRMFRPLFWFAAAGTAACTARMVTGIMRRMITISH